MIVFRIAGTKVTDSLKQTAPSYSFGSRHRKRQDTAGPGPAEYDVTGLGAKGKATPPMMSLQSRPKDKKVITTPGPGEYNVDKAEKAAIERAPIYSMRDRFKSNKVMVSPGNCSRSSRCLRVTN